MKDKIDEIFKNPNNLELIIKYFKERADDFEKNRSFLLSDKFIEIDKKIHNLMLSGEIEKTIDVNNFDNKIINANEINDFVNAALTMEKEKDNKSVFQRYYVKTEYLIVSVTNGQGTLIEISLKN